MEGGEKTQSLLSVTHLVGYTPDLTSSPRRGEALYLFEVSFLAAVETLSKIYRNIICLEALKVTLVVMLKVLVNGSTMTASGVLVDAYFAFRLSSTCGSVDRLLCSWKVLFPAR